MDPIDQEAEWNRQITFLVWRVLEMLILFVQRSDEGVGKLRCGELGDRAERQGA